MRLLLFILFPASLFAQPTITNVSSGFSTTGIGSISGPTLTAGKFYIIFTGTSNSGSDPATVSLSGTGQTWTETGPEGGVLSGSNDRRIQAFYYYATTTTTSDVTVTYTGTQDGGWIALYEIMGALTTGTNGVDAIIQVGTNSDAATQHPSVSLAALAARASVICGFVNDVNPVGGTAEAGWTESIDNGYATPDTGGYILYRTGTTDNTPSLTAGTFSNWAGLAIELKSIENQGLPLYFFN